MPRQSAEAQAAARFRAGGRHPGPPKDMPKAAADLWREIVETRPVDFFRPGSLELLAHFCRLSVVQRANLATLEVTPSDAGQAKLVTGTAAALSTMATKLRISVQAEVDRKSRVISEQEPAASPSSSLLGGHAVELRKH